MTTNITESINSKLLIEREFPIVTLFYAIQRILSRWFHEHCTESDNFTTTLVLSAEKLLRERMELSNALFAYPLDAQEFTMSGYGSDALFNLHSKTCSCKVLDIHYLPCPYALVALKHQ